MSPQSNDGRKGFEAGADLDRGVRVKLSSGTVVAAGSGEEGIGNTTESCNDGDFVDVRLDGHTVEAIASGTINENADCYPAADGAVSATIAGRRVGKCIEAAADTELFEMMVIGVNS